MVVDDPRIGLTVNSARRKDTLLFVADGVAYYGTLLAYSNLLTVSREVGVVSPCIDTPVKTNPGMDLLPDGTVPPNLTSNDGESDIL